MENHPLAVKGTKAEDRWAQTKHEIWQPLPVKQITVSVSGAGKSSVIQAAVNALFDHFDYFAVYSHSHTLDPSYGDLKDRIREKAHKNKNSGQIEKGRGRDTYDHDEKVEY